jgi:hypothetical protein
MMDGIDKKMVFSYRTEIRGIRKWRWGAFTAEIRGCSCHAVVVM